MLCEVLYRVGDGGSWKDGNPIEVRSTGVFVTEAQFADWLTGTEPTSIGTLRPQRAAKMRQFAQRMRTLLDTNIDVAAVAAASSIQPEDVDAQRVDALSIRERIAAFGGVDSTWGFEELRKMSVMIADLSVEDIEEATATVEELADGTIEPRLVSRRPCFVDYRTLLSADSVDLIADPEILVPPARGETPFDFATLLTEG